MKLTVMILGILCAIQSSAQRLDCCKTSDDAVRLLLGFWKEQDRDMNVAYHYFIEDDVLKLNEIEYSQKDEKHVNGTITETLTLMVPHGQPKIGVTKSESGFEIHYWYRYYEGSTAEIIFLSADMMILKIEGKDKTYERIPKLF